MQRTSKKEVTCFTALPVELLRTVADYLTVEEFYAAFSGITHMLTLLSEQMWLACARLPSNPSQTLWRRLAAGSDRIRALVLIESAASVAFLGQPNWPLLRSVAFVSVDPQEIGLVLQSYLPMEQLESITIETRHSENVRPNDFVSFLNPDDMPSLYCLTLRPHPDSLHWNSTNLQCLSSEFITHFTLSHALDLDQLPLLLKECFPRLIYLNVHLGDINRSLGNTQFRHEHLRSLVVHLDNDCFGSDVLNRTVFALDTISMMPNLERYSLHCWSRVFPDINQWLSPHLQIPKDVSHIRLHFEVYSLLKNLTQDDRMKFEETVTKLRSAMNEHYACMNSNFIFDFSHINEYR
jgi:hypothetical protein